MRRTVSAADAKDRLADALRQAQSGDLARAPAPVKPALRLIRANLFRRRLTAERLQGVLHVGAHDCTSEFRRTAGVAMHRYFADRRLEAAARLLLDTELEVKGSGLLVGYSGSEAERRAIDGPSLPSAFPRRRESTLPGPWIPAFAGMTERRPDPGSDLPIRGPEQATPPVGGSGVSISRLSRRSDREVAAIRSRMAGARRRWWQRTDHRRNGALPLVAEDPSQEE